MTVASPRFMLLLGSGVSLPTGLPGTEQITRAILNEEPPPVPSRQGSRRACKPSSELCAAQEKWLAILHWKCSSSCQTG
jgi:hypothetical protein